MIQMRTIFIANETSIPLGYQGENLAREIVFPQTADLLGENWTLFHRRARDNEPYPVPLGMDARGLVWKVTSGDTANMGGGQAQLICTGGDGEVLKTMVYRTVVSKSMVVGGEPPDPVKPWYDAIMEALAEAEAGADGGYYRMEIQQVDEDTMTVAYIPSKEDMPTVAPVTVTLPAGPQGERGLQGVAGPAGAKGDKGDQGEQGPQGIQGEQGPRGLQGERGLQGATGPAGADGKDGAQGPKGDKGDTGPKGDKGDTGDTGPAGPTGATGPAGPTGATGPAGATPVKGTDYWTASDKAEIVKDTLAEIQAGGGGGTVKTVNGVAPDEDGNVTIETGSDVDELDALSTLMDTGVVDPMTDENGAVYVDEAGNLYSF